MVIEFHLYKYTKINFWILCIHFRKSNSNQVEKPDFCKILRKGEPTLFINHFSDEAMITPTLCKCTLHTKTYHLIVTHLLF